MDIPGKHALITGAGSGIGRATALLLSERRAGLLTLIDVDRAGLAETAAAIGRGSGQLEAIVCDVSDAGALEAAFARAADRQALDIVFNNAGIMSGTAMFPDCSLGHIERLLGVNLNGVVMGTLLAVRHMAGRGGVVINTSSLTAGNASFPDILYGTSKAAVAYFTRSAGQIRDATGVRVCGVCPGLVDTPILQSTGGDRPADWVAPILARSRPMPPRAIAEGVVRQIEDEAAIGTIIEVLAV